jgi:polysaccharide export outer membrane protein
MRNLSLSLVLLVACALGCCAGPQYNSDLFRAQLTAPYQLASGDRLRVIVFGQDSLTNSYSVDGAGNISMPLIGAVKAHGLTTAELEGSIAGKLRNGFLRDPQVAVEVEAFRPFFILGEVQTGGQYPFINGMTVQNAIAVAGGFTPRGNQSGADITRMVNGRSVTGWVPLTFPVRPGDTVTVRERFF